MNKSILAIGALLLAIGVAATVIVQRHAPAPVAVQQPSDPQAVTPVEPPPTSHDESSTPEIVLVAPPQPAQQKSQPAPQSTPIPQPTVARTPAHAPTTPRTTPAPVPEATPVPIPVARYALSLVGADPEAEGVWAEAINDPNMPASARKDLIEDLNEEGFPDPKNLTPDDLPLILNRLELIEAHGPLAMDDVNAAAFDEAYKDLLNMLEKVTR